MILPHTLFALVVAATPADSRLLQTHDYHVHVDPQLSYIAVEACFDGRVPEALFAGSPSAGALLEEASALFEGERRSLRYRRTVMRIPNQPDDGCLRYRVDLGQAMRSMDMGIAARVGDAAVFSPRIWLWRPRTLTRLTDVRLHFDLPQGMKLSGPWRLVSPDDAAPFDYVHPDGEHPVFRLGYPPTGWGSSMLLGQFQRHRMEAGGLQLDIATTDGPGDALPDETVMAWLERGLEAGAAVWGRYPVDRAQAIVVPLDLGERPLAEGRVSRAGGMGLLLGMGTEFTAEDFRNDPLIAHEFMHVLLPPVESRHNWLSEGIATYYQYLGLARAGRINPEQAWERFMSDLNDGRWDRRPGTLLDVSASMGENGGADYVYWSGAALMLMSDVALRRRSDNQQTLGDVLVQWTEDSFDSRRSADGLHVLRRLDEYADGEPLFEPLYDEYVLSAGFPEIGPLLDDLGLPRPGEEFELDDDAPLAPIRRAIMRPHDEPLIPAAENPGEP